MKNYIQQISLLSYTVQTASLCLLCLGFQQRLTCHRWKKLWLMGVGHYFVSSGVANCLGQSGSDFRVCPSAWIFESADCNHVTQCLDQIHFSRCVYVTWASHLLTTLTAIPGSFIFTMIALPLYAIIAPLLNFSLEYTGIVPRLWADPVFYFVLLLFPIICLLRDYVWK